MAQNRCLYPDHCPIVLLLYSIWNKCLKLHWGNLQIHLVVFHTWMLSTGSISIDLNIDSQKATNQKLAIVIERLRSVYYLGGKFASNSSGVVNSLADTIIHNRCRSALLYFHKGFKERSLVNWLHKPGWWWEEVHISPKCGRTTLI